MTIPGDIGARGPIGLETPELYIPGEGIDCVGVVQGGFVGVFLPPVAPVVPVPPTGGFTKFSSC